MRRAPLAWPLEGRRCAFRLTGRPTFIISGLLLHRLCLKVGLPVTTMRSANPSNGLANGTRLILRELERSMLDCKVVRGAVAGAHTDVPRVNMTPSCSSRSSAASSRPAFAVTVNKALGHMSQRLGAYSPCSLLSHGQLYVAASQVVAPVRTWSRCSLGV